jgi:hypothetical protein
MSTTILNTKALSNEQIQVLLTGKFGDGCFATNSHAKQRPDFNWSYYYVTSSINIDYILYKEKLLGSLCRTKILCSENKGYKKNLIFKLSTLSHQQITEIAKESLEASLCRMDELGFALWLYDDGSLHRKKQFYNLNTQAFSREVQYDLFVPFLKNRFGIVATPTIERKADGRSFWYLRIKKYDGAFTASEILSKYPIHGFEYKRIEDKTIEKWNTLQKELKSKDIDITSLHKKTLCSMLNKCSLTLNL